MQKEVDLDILRLMKEKISILCPTFNESGIAVHTLRQLYELCLTHVSDFEIIIIDDASSDDNYRQIADFAKDKKQIIVKRHTRNRGTASTMNELYQLARGEFVIIFSLDGEWECRDVIRMVEQIREHPNLDVLVGQRKHKQYTVGRKIVSFLFNFLPRLVFGVHTYDAGGIKLLRQSLVEQLPVVSSGVFNEAERIIRAAKLGCQIDTIAISHLPSRKKIKPIPDIKLILEAVVDIVRVWLSLHQQPKRSNQS